MKKGISTVYIVFLITMLVFACKNKSKEAATTEAEDVAVTKPLGENYITDINTSVIEWKGFKPTGSHYGTLNLESGSIIITEGDISGGIFLINMASLKDSEGNKKLVGHLKSPDFFDVEKYPNATFEITDFQEIAGKTMLSGNLTLKDVKKNVSFPVNITNEGNSIALTSETFTIDRTKWNVQFGSKTIFDNLGDKFINDDFELKVIVNTTKL